VHKVELRSKLREAGPQGPTHQIKIPHSPGAGSAWLACNARGALAPDAGAPLGALW